jgi:hypothetical protein
MSDTTVRTVTKFCKTCNNGESVTYYDGVGNKESIMSEFEFINADSVPYTIVICDNCKSLVKTLCKEVLIEEGIITKKKK